MDHTIKPAVRKNIYIESNITKRAKTFVKYFDFIFSAIITPSIIPITVPIEIHKAIPSCIVPIPISLEIIPHYPYLL